jgi:D-lactate dehydrogenase
LSASEPPIAPLDAALIKALHGLFADDQLILDPAGCRAYGYDNSRRRAVPQAVAFASEHRQVVELVKLCRRYRTPLIARGRGTGTTGATVPDRGGIVLSFERMDRILEIDSANRIARVEPGVTNQALQQAAAAAGFFWPPDPTSAAVCSIGGNLAYNSAGPRAVKYGTPRENTLALTAVTGCGETIHCGTATTKGVVGFDLTRLLIGSEGTLAIITEARLKLTPLPQAKRTLRAIYADIQGAAAAVSAIMAQPATPCALEFMDSEALDLIRDRPDLDLPDQARAMLMIEVDGAETCLQPMVEAISSAASNPQLLSLRATQSADEGKALWKARSALSPAMRRIAPKKINEDVAVPVSRIPELIGGLGQLAEQHRIRIVNFGHAGNGNIHVNLLIDPDDPHQAQQAEICLDRVFDLVLGLDGTLSGEHGIGLEKRDFVDRELSDPTLKLMRSLKRLFDPADILNPGKGLPPPK